APTTAFAGPPLRAQAASARDRALSTVANACRSLRPSASSSIALARPTVQVMTEAKARPMMTASTIWLADRNMLRGDRSLGNVAASARSRSADWSWANVGAALATAMRHAATACGDTLFHTAAL